MLALGNCMADWVADTVVAKSGNTQMAFASCFGSPMLSHILGLSIAFTVSSILHAYYIVLLKMHAYKYKHWANLFSYCSFMNTME